MKWGIWRTGYSSTFIQRYTGPACGLLVQLCLKLVKGLFARSPVDSCFMAIWRALASATSAAHSGRASPHIPYNLADPLASSLEISAFENNNVLDDRASKGGKKAAIQVVPLRSVVMATIWEGQVQRRTLLKKDSKHGESCAVPHPLFHRFSR